MKQPVALGVAALFFMLVAASSLCFAQGTFKIPFAFQSGGKKFGAGDYRVDHKGDQQIVLHQVSGGNEIVIPVLKTLPQTNPPAAEPQLVFDAVGNFEPSYTEYVTDYVLAEVWLPGQDGFLVHETKGGHSHQTIKGQKVEK
jgi:hypothetical protein